MRILKRIGMGGTTLLCGLPALLGATTVEKIELFPFTIGPLHRAGALNNIEIFMGRYDEIRDVESYEARCEVFSESLGYSTRVYADEIYTVSDPANYVIAHFNLESYLPLGDAGALNFQIGLTSDYPDRHLRNFRIPMSRQINNHFGVTGVSNRGTTNYQTIVENANGATVYNYSPIYTFPNFAKTAENPKEGKIDLSVFDFTYTSGVGHNGLAKGTYENMALMTIIGAHAPSYSFLGGTVKGSQLTNIPVKIVENSKEDGSRYYSVKFNTNLAYKVSTGQMTGYSNVPPSGYTPVDSLYFPHLDGQEKQTLRFQLTLNGGEIGTGDFVHYEHVVTNERNVFGSCHNSDYCVGVGL